MTYKFKENEVIVREQYNRLVSKDDVGFLPFSMCFENEDDALIFLQHHLIDIIKEMNLSNKNNKICAIQYYTLKFPKGGVNITLKKFPLTDV